MCFIDAFNMRQENIKDDYLHYRRSKTGASMQVKITPEMVRIIRMYRQKKTDGKYSLPSSRRSIGV